MVGIVIDQGCSVRSANMKAVAGRAVTVCIRPEHLHPTGEADGSVSGTVEMVEQLGADTLVHIAHGRDLVIARLPHRAQPDIGTRFSVTADPARVFLFDTASGARV